MILREDIANFLAQRKDLKKEDVISAFSNWAFVHGVKVDKLGKMIADLRSYKEWIWGE